MAFPVQLRHSGSSCRPMPQPEISPWLVAGLCILYYMAPATLLPLILACAVHEAAHLLCARLFGLRVQRFELTLLGARLQAESSTDRALLICTLAGPAASLALGAILPVWPQLGLVSLMLGIFNLLPFRALDGGQILLLLCRSEAAFHRTQSLFLILLTLCALALAALGFGLWPILTVCALILRAGLETAVAKRAENG